MTRTGAEPATGRPATGTAATGTAATGTAATGTAAEPEKTGEQLAAEKTAAVQRQIKALDQLLTSAVRLEPFSFDRLLSSPAIPRFDPGWLALTLTAPNWETFSPVPPAGLGRLFRRSSHKRRLTAARAEYQAAQTSYLHAEGQRSRALAAAKAKHDREVTEEHARATGQNSDIARRRLAFASGDAESVEWFVGQALDASRYLNVFPRDYQVTYHPRTVHVQAELPPGRIVPSARAFRHVASRNTVEQLPRADREIRQRYKRVVCSAALRVLHVIFAATPEDVVDTVVFSGWASAADPATGKAIRPCLVSVTTDRAAFADLVLTSAEPVACVAHLSGVVSPDPYGMVPIS